MIEFGCTHIHVRRETNEPSIMDLLKLVFLVIMHNNLFIGKWNIFCNV